MSTKWLPIDTAPRDGTPVLLGWFDENGEWIFVRGAWREDVLWDWLETQSLEAGWFEICVSAKDYDSSYTYWPVKPTHWSAIAAPSQRKVWSRQDFPMEVLFCLDSFLQPGLDERTLYSYAEIIAHWFEDNSEAEAKGAHECLAEYLIRLKPERARTLLAGLSDSDFSTKDSRLIFAVESSVMSEDKELAQCTAIFLVTCCGRIGKGLLAARLKEPEFHHKNLVQGIFDLLTN